MPYESWADKQIREATERGEFDNLPGAGKPIQGLGGRHDPDWWLKNLIEREQISMPLPEGLQLRKELAGLPELLEGIRGEDAVRELVRVLNQRIRQHRIRPDGPAVFIADLDAERVVADWHERGGH